MTTMLLFTTFFYMLFMSLKGSPGAAVKLLPCDHGFMLWKQPLAEMQGKTAYIRPKVVGPCPDPAQVGAM
jgi:hypothetical protein